MTFLGLIVKWNHDTRPKPCHEPAHGPGPVAGAGTRNGIRARYLGGPRARSPDPGRAQSAGSAKTLRCTSPTLPMAHAPRRTPRRTPFVRSLVVSLVATLLLAGCHGPADGPFVGERAPGFSVETLDGSRFDLADHQGRVVVLDLMGANCPPCRLSMEHLTEAAARLGPDPDTVMVSVDVGTVYPGLGARDAAELTAFRDEHNGTWAFAMDHEDGVGAAYLPAAMPTLVVIGPDGIVHARYDGGLIEADQILADVAAAHGEGSVPA